MAITSATMNAALGSDGNKNMPRVVCQLPPFGTALQYWVINGGVTYRNRQRRCVTNAASIAIVQANDVRDQLRAGSAP